MHNNNGSAQMKDWIRSNLSKFADKDNIDFQVNCTRTKKLGDNLAARVKARLLIFLETHYSPNSRTTNFQKNDYNFVALTC